MHISTFQLYEESFQALEAGYYTRVKHKYRLYQIK